MREEREKGYGKSVTCKKCATVETSENDPNKPKRIWNWKAKPKLAPEPQKKKTDKQGKSVTGKAVSSPISSDTLKYVCLQCLSFVLKQGKEERRAFLCRNDNSSVKRHKTNWQANLESKNVL